MFSKPKICFFDIGRVIREKLQEKGFNITNASMGTRIKLPIESTYAFGCNVNYDIPEDLHEYEILVLNFQSGDTKVYIPNEHKIKHSASSTSGQFKCKYPQRVFNPVPLAANRILGYLKNKAHNIKLMVVFAAQEEVCHYEYETINIKLNKQSFLHTNSNYDCLEFNFNRSNKSGQEIEAVKNTPLYEFLRKYTDKARYEVIFGRSDSYIADKIMVNSDMFVPLMKNSYSETISFILKGPKYNVLFFPCFRDQEGFIEELFCETLPSVYPELFPFSSLFGWLSEEKYYLPNVAQLIEKRTAIEETYQNDVKTVQKEIENNKERYAWLHDILTETGDKLVETVDYFLKWLGFNSVRMMDVGSGKKQEDIQVDIPNGLLVVEVKGISGTSTDSDCEQITKIRNRRAEERCRFDVYGLYIVNHQRFLPPHKRSNPPFNEDQIKDAKADKRGLLTTFQLFNLYFDIENGFISKEEARNALQKVGLIEFNPSNSCNIGKPKELYYNGTVVIIEIKNKIRIGDRILIKRDDRIASLKVLELRVNNETVEEVQSGEVGIKLDCSVNATDDLYFAL